MIWKDPSFIFSISALTSFYTYCPGNSSFIFKKNYVISLLICKSLVFQHVVIPYSHVLGIFFFLFSLFCDFRIRLGYSSQKVPWFFLLGWRVVSALPSHTLGHTSTPPGIYQLSFTSEAA